MGSFVDEDIFGNIKCANEQYRLGLRYDWLFKYLCRTPTSTESAARRCITHDQAYAQIVRGSPLCVQCGCGEEYPNCDVTPNFTAYNVVDASFQPAALPGQTYLIRSNFLMWGGTWASHVGELVTDTTFQVILPGQITLNASNGRYWVQTSVGQAPYFPPVSGTLSGTTLTLVSYYPTENDEGGKDVLIEVSSDSITWVGVYIGPEGTIPATVTVASDTAFVRATYYTENQQLVCPHTAVTGNIPAQIPQSVYFDPGAYMKDVADVPFNFCFPDEPTWTLAFYYRADDAQTWPFLLEGHNPLFIPGVPQGMDAFGTWLLVTEAILDAPNYPDPPISTYYSLRMGGDNNNPFNLINAFQIPNNTNFPFDGQWHHFAFVKSNPDSSVPIRIYVDGINMNAFIYGTYVPRVAQDFTPALAFGLGDGSGSAGFKTVDTYVCRRPYTQAEVQSILMTRTIASSIAIDDPQMWVQPGAADAIGVSPYISSNVSGVPALTPFTGTITFSTDVP